MSRPTFACAAVAAVFALAPIACSDSASRDTFDGDVSKAEPDAGDFGRGNPSACPDGKKTTISGKVYDPAGDLPLYNAIVFSPTRELDDLPSGASCDGRCGVPVSGAPRAATLSKSDGTFVLEVPAGKGVPVVVQLGKWRRRAVVPNVVACTDNALVDPHLTRLPRNAKEGSLPRVAIETGEYDALECLLLRLGVDASEFTAPGGTGHFQLYKASAGAVLDSGPAVDGRKLWSNASVLKSYDAVMFECAGPDYPTLMGPAERANVVAYADAGGRVFTTDYAGLAWLREGAAPFPQTASWKSGAARSTFLTSIDRSFPKGKAFGEWLYAVHATTQPTAGLTVQSSTSIVTKVEAVVAPSERWLYATTGGAPLQYSFNTPVSVPAEAQCGRVVFNDFHVSDSSGDYASGADRRFPSGCRAGSPSPQELALAFMIFDLGSCIQDATKDPIQPR